MFLLFSVNTKAVAFEAGRCVYTDVAIGGGSFLDLTRRDKSDGKSLIIAMGITGSFASLAFGLLQMNRTGPFLVLLSLCVVRIVE